MVTLTDYEAAVAPARVQFAGATTLRTLFLPDLAADRLEAFLVHFSAFGVGMTEPVEGWIRRAGERCRGIGFDELGRALEIHARHEADHHLMMIEDTRKLVARWNARRAPALDADELLQRPPSPGCARYRALHEDVIASGSPYAQIAIEYEIERLSVEHGAPLIGRCVERLGPGIVEGLSFLEEHVAIDQGHTKFNAAELAKVLAKAPSALAALTETAGAALAAYSAFLDDCFAAACAVAAGG